MDALGAPSTVEESRRLGRAAVHAVLRMAAGFPGGVVDSTWYPYARPLVDRLTGPLVEVRCRVDVAVARERFHGRQRDERHLDLLRSEAELWGSEVPALGVGPVVEVDTTGPVDVPALARSVEHLLGVGVDSSTHA